MAQAIPPAKQILIEYSGGLELPPALDDWLTDVKAGRVRNDQRPQFHGRDRRGHVAVVATWPDQREKSSAVLTFWP